MARPATTVSGLQPYPAYKPSGVEWLGDIPAYWRVATVKRQDAIRLGKMLQTSGHASDDCRVPYLKAKHVQWFEVQTTGIDTMWASPDDIERYGVAAGDLLVCEGGEGGRCGMIRHGTDLPDPCIIQNALHRVRPLSWRSAADASQNDYLLYLMSAIAASGWFDALSDKATIASLYGGEVGALPGIDTSIHRASNHRPLPRSRRPVHPAVHPCQGETGQAAGGSAAGPRQRGRHGPDRCSHRATVPCVQAVWSGGTAGGAVALGRSSGQVAFPRG